ncbi:cyclic pyranopterin monophosphate synthase MoaC [Kyrpidia spormannii]|uniref:Molybdenum cofactor biosynthesis protein C n=1 Tax=Kyrpidia spormannii TaxID=2055160 RepID=A0ACA8ZAF6_9BACL|nr:cyclic pyranopterin monophosphate synthase MoaC [Kyrpidia spormannii]CAB3392864.1 molybdenum cofactor biosynthesis protein C [Kyrpidia spormannii]
MAEWSHFNEQGRAKMSDVSGKEPTKRTAVARAVVRMKQETLSAIQEGRVKKGDVLAVAQVAGVMAAKRTPDLIPMCHTIPLTHVDLRFFPRESEGRRDFAELEIESEVSTVASTGVEMEALTAVSVAALTVYDMCKAIDRAMEVTSVYLLEKSGGKSGDYRRDEPRRRNGV